MLEPRERRALLRQRAVSRALAPLWIPLAIAAMRWWLGWSIEGVRELRREYARLRAESDAPLLICANHLTMADSLVIGWALGGVGDYLRDFGAMAWNTPERRHFASTWWKRMLAYVAKCVPITRGADRREVARVLEQVGFLMSLGEAALIFPEGGRSRTSRVDTENAAYGVGRLVAGLPGCRVLCVYCRGDGQQSWADLPAKGEHFRVSVACIEPKSDARGLRGSLQIAQQIVNRIAEMEQAYFDDRQ